MKGSIAFAAITAALCLAPAHAQSPDRIVHTHIVPYNDLNLGSAAGRRELDRRIRTAVHDVCGDASSADLAGMNDVRGCRHMLMQHLVALPIGEARLSAR